MNLVASATDAVQYIWSGPNGFIQNGAELVITDAPQESSGTYTVTASSAEGCVSTLDVVVSITERDCEADAWVEFTDAENCDDENGVAVLAPSEYTYEWSDGGIGSVREDLANGTFTVTVTDNDGCQTILTVTIDETGNCDDCVAPTINNTVIVQATCGESNGSATIMTAGNPADYTYTWIPNVGLSLIHI